MTDIKVVYDSITRSIVPCPVCKTAGVVEKLTHTDYHKREDFYAFFPCDKCGTDGRMVEVKRSVRISLMMSETKYADLVDTVLEKLNGRSSDDIYDKK